MTDKTRQYVAEENLLSAEASDDMSDPVLKKYMDPVIREALVDLFRIKTSFESLIDLVEHDKIKDIQYRLRLVTGSMVMLSLGRAAKVMHYCGEYISNLTFIDKAGHVNPLSVQSFMGVIDDMSRYLCGLSRDENYQEAILNAMEDATIQMKRTASINASTSNVSVMKASSSDISARHEKQIVPANDPEDDMAMVPLHGREKLSIELERDFLQTARKNIKAGGMVLRMLAKSPESVVLAKEFRKILHTLRDNALAAGISEVVELCHSLELLVVMLVRREDQHTDEINDLLAQSYEQLTVMVEQYNHHGNMTPVEDLVYRINRRLMGPFRGAGSSDQPDEDSLEAPVPGHGTGDRDHKKHPVKFKKNNLESSDNLIRRHPGNADAYVTDMGSIQSDIEGSYARLKSYLDSMKTKVDQFRLSLNRDKTFLLLHDGGDILDANKVLAGYLDESDKLYDQGMQLMNLVDQCLMQQQQVIVSLKAEIRQKQIVTVASQIAQLDKIIGRMGRDLSRKIRLKVIGGHLQLDQVLLSKIIEPVISLISYRLENGIEESAARHSAGKPEIASVTLEFSKEASDLVIRIHDDGENMDMDEMRNTPLSDVAGMVKSIGGSMVIAAAKNPGANFIIRIPCELDINQVLMVQVNEEIYAIPSANIEDIIYLQVHEINTLNSGHDSRYQYHGIDYQFRNLGAVLGMTPSVQPEKDRQYPIVLMSMGSKFIALQVDKVKGQREIIVNRSVPELNRVKVISGATLLSDGRLVLVLELGALLGEDVGYLKAIRQL